MYFPVLKLKRISFFVAIESLAVFAIYAGALNREISFLIFGGIILALTFLSIEEATAFFIVSIPLFIALPINQNFDNFAAWRVIVFYLFLMWLIKEKIIFSLFDPDKIKQIVGRILGFEWCIILFMFIAVFSLLVAENQGFGLRKIIFLANVFPLYVVIRALAEKKDIRSLMFLSILGAGAISATVGFIQFISIQFVSLFDFWKHWVQWVTPIFYGHSLAVLLEKSNTWFSYYAASPPTLRLFSVFPDSHSFGLFSLLAACAALILFKLHTSKYRFLFLFFWIILSLNIYLSGTRGLWLAVLPLIFSVVTVYLFTNNILDNAKKFAGVFLLSFTVCTALIYFILDKIALSIAFGACNPTPFLCTDLAIKAYQFPYSLWVITAALCASIIIALMSFLLIVKIKIFGDTLLPQTMLVPLIIFLLLLPVSSFVIAHAHGKGIIFENEKLLLARAASILDITEESNKARIDIWKITVNSIVQHPVLGVGIGNYAKVLGENIDASKRGASAHNLYLDFAAETGVMGGGLVVGFFLTLVLYANKLFKTLDNRALGAVFGVYFVWIMLYNFFDVVLINDKVLLLFAALLGTFSGLFIERLAQKNNE